MLRFMAYIKFDMIFKYLYHRYRYFIFLMKEHKQKLSIALKKASSSLQNVIQMVEDDKYCIDILQQVNAVMGLLRGASARIVENHLKMCGHEKMKNKDESVRDDFVKELMQALHVASRK